MKKPKILVGIVVYNEEGKIDKVLSNVAKVLKIAPYTFAIVDDHSSDNTVTTLKKFAKKYKRVVVITNKENSGVGKSIKNIISYGIERNYSVCAIMAGNGKDNPLEVKKLLKPILEKEYDYVQGSRFLHGGSFHNLPFARKMMIKGFTWMVWLVTNYSGTDASNGFRAYKLSLFTDKRITINQSWLDRYEFETYLHYKVITLGYKYCEVAVSKNYLPDIKNYSKIRPLIDWWKMMRPLILLKLHIKK